MPSSGGDHCCLPLRQPSWMRSLLRKKVTISDVPEELLLHILSLVPRKYLVLSCRRVCSRWRDLVDLPILWKHKCRRMGFRMEGSDSGLPDWMTFCFRQSQRNLVKNPCGEEFFNFWEARQPCWEVSNDIMLRRCVQFYERSLRIPRPPQEIQRCFIFSSSGGTLSGTKRQRITLREEGYSDRLMDESRPKIIVKDWQYFSWMSDSQLHVKLLSAGLEVLQECSLSGFDICDWWNELSHTFENYPPGVRHIDLEHKVSTRNFVKITGTSVTIDPEGTHEEGATTAEKSRFPAIFNLCLPATLQLEAREL
nr:PREDICTED: F-box only protein 44 isoform X1 [Anolis carolinensis]|eukprot:XP_008121569.1 PREDICTED: F-box only protein 44 isoform X1 [Anolis carolinensis]